MRSILQCDLGKSVTAAAHMACHCATMACYYATMPPTHQRCIMDRAPISRRFVIGSQPNGSLFHYHCRLRSEARPTDVSFITTIGYPCRFANGLESSLLSWMEAVVDLVVVGQRDDYFHQELKTAQRILIPRPRRIILYRLQITTSLIYVFSKYRLVITTIIYVVIRIRLLNTLQLGMDFISLVSIRKYKVILHK